ALSCTVTAYAEMYTLSLHDALPICGQAEEGLGQVEASSHEGADRRGRGQRPQRAVQAALGGAAGRLHRGDPGEDVRRGRSGRRRSEEHTSELQSREKLVGRLLLEKK